MSFEATRAQGAESQPDSEFAFVAYPPLRQGYSPPLGWRSLERGGQIDAIVLTATVPGQALNLVFDKVGDPLIPVVSFVPNGAPWLDVAGVGDNAAWERAHAIQMRLRELPEEIRFSWEPEDVLLARMYSRDVPLAASYNPRACNLVGYPAAGRMLEPECIALKLCDEGYLTKSFFDRLHCCPDCRSSTLNVREECHKCRSPNIQEEVMVHHFKCGHTQPESKFRTGNRYECPKCANPLRHIGLDYDKPGSIFQCLDCADVNDRPIVGFKCIHCGNHHDSESIPTVTWYSFAMTVHGLRRVRGDLTTPRVTTRPDAFQILLEQAQREAREFKTPHQVVRVRIINADEIRRKSVRVWEQSRKLMLDGLHSALRVVDSIREEETGVLILLPHTDWKNANKLVEQIRKRVAQVVKADLELEFESVDMAQPEREKAAAR